MKHLFLTALLSAFCIAANAQDTQTICPGEVKYYHIDEPAEGSQYIWSITPDDAGVITYDSGTHGRISVAWKKDGTLSVYEKNAAGCDGDAASVAVKISGALSAEFDNEAACYGEQVNIKFPSGAAWPISFSYSIDGEVVNIAEYNKDTYPMENKSGFYKLLKVTDSNGCEVVPAVHNTSVIAPELKKLTIQKE